MCEPCEEPGAEEGPLVLVELAMLVIVSGTVKVCLACGCGAWGCSRAHSNRHDD